MERPKPPADHRQYDQARLVVRLSHGGLFGQRLRLAQSGQFRVPISLGAQRLRQRQTSAATLLTLSSGASGKDCSKSSRIEVARLITRFVVSSCMPSTRISSSADLTEERIGGIHGRLIVAFCGDAAGLG